MQRIMRLAQERALESAMLNRAVRPQVTEEAVKARYDQDYAGKPGETGNEGPFCQELPHDSAAGCAKGEPDPDLARRIELAAFERGLLVLSCGRSTIRLAPPLTIDATDVVPVPA